MNFDSSWDIFKYKTTHEPEEHWEFREKFLIAHKDKFPEDRLVCLAQVFFNVEILGCKYPQQTMDLIESLSKGLADDLRQSRKSRLQRTFVTASSAVKTKGNCQAAMLLSSNEMPVQIVNCSSPYDPQYILPGFILYVKDNLDSSNIIERSCAFSNSTKKFTISRENGIVKTSLFIQNKLIACGSGTSEKTSRKDAIKHAHIFLKKHCFTIKEKEDLFDSVNKNDILKSKGNSIDDSSNVEKNSMNNPANALPDDNVGNKLLKMMGWKTGSGLGKNEQGRTEPVEVIQLPKNMGLGNTNEAIGSSAKQKMMFALRREVIKHLRQFKSSQKKKLTFSTEFTKDERKMIHLSCQKLGLKTKSYGLEDCRHVVIAKRQSAQEIVQELIGSENLENEYYTLLPPNSESEN